MAPKVSNPSNTTSVRKGPRDPRVSNKSVSSIVGTIVTIYVGSSATKYYVHKSLLSQSPFFRAALEGDFTESHTGEILLPEDDPDIFAIYSHWLYTGNIACEMEKGTPIDFKSHRRRYSSLFRCYILGDRCCHNEFMNAVMTTIIYHYQTKIQNKHYGPHVHEVNLVYENLLQADMPLKRWLIDCWVQGLRVDGSFMRSATTDTLHAQFVLDLAKGLVRWKCGLQLTAKKPDFDCEHYHVETPKTQAFGPSGSSSALTNA